jgi:CRP/FNR family transcriptional regulator, cyclic AMP receptor protein
MTPKTASAKSRIDTLKTIPLFSACSKSELRNIANIVKESEFPAGHTICKEGETGIGLHVLVEGEAEVKIGGRERARLAPGSSFGEIALLDGGPRSATIITRTPARTLSIPVWAFRNTLKNHPSLTVKMLEEACRRLRAADSSAAH